MAENPLPPYVHTNWSHYDLPAIWQQIQPEDDFFTRLQERAWNRTYDLLDAHRAKLESLFDGLAQVWPPVAGSASEAYLSQLRTLIAGVARTSHDASGNALAVSSIGDTLMNSRAKIQALQQQTGQPYDAGKLSKQAAAVMTESEKATYDYATLLREPEPAKPDWVDQLIYPPEGPNGQTEEPATAPDWSHSSAGSGAGSAAAGAGPDTRPQPTSPPVLTSAPPSSPPLQGTASSHGETGVPPSYGQVRQWPSGLIGSAAPQTRASEQRSRSLNVPESDVFAEHASMGSANRTANAHAARESAAAEHGMVGPTAMTGGGAARSRRRRAMGPAYTEWAVARGVSPVLRPPPEPTTFDPGPGVFGIDR